MLFRRRDKKNFMQTMKHTINPEKGWKRVGLYYLYRLKRRPGSPEFIAMGFACGVAINFWPILFTHFVFGFILCRILRGDILAMFMGTLLGNPWTFAIVYPMMYKIGKAFLGLRPTHNMDSLDSAEEVLSRIWPIHSWDNLLHAFQDIIIPMMIGGFLLAVPTAIISYYLTRNALRVYQTQRLKRLQRHFDEVEEDIETTIVQDG
jgi:uncharacterized protein (DUF2062 family)